MQNMKLSGKLREYFIHALKGIGVGYVAPDQEESEADIAKFLDDPATTTDQIYERIKAAIGQQLNVDAQTEKFAQSNTLFDRATVTKVFGDKIIKTSAGQVKLRPEVVDIMLKNLTDSTKNAQGFNLDRTTEMVIDFLFAGMNEQKLNQEEKETGAQLWQGIRLTSYQKWLATQKGRKDLPSLEEYYNSQLKAELLHETTERCGGNQEIAKGILNASVDADMMKYLKANNYLWQQSCEICAQRGKNPETDLTMEDVLAATASESSGTQVIAYFQTRARGQAEKLKANPKTIEVNKTNKIGNLIGKAAQKAFKKVKKSVVVSVDRGSGLPKGKAGPWRGYKKLYDRIFNFLKEMYGNVMSIGFVQGIMERNGTWINTEVSGVESIPEAQEDLTKAWQTKHRDMPDAYRDQAQGDNKRHLNVAGEFYNKTKARLLADKMRLISLSAKIESGTTDPNELAKLQAKSTYLNDRINRAETVLAQKMPQAGDKLFDSQQYFDYLEKFILGEETLAEAKVKAEEQAKADEPVQSDSDQQQDNQKQTKQKTVNQDIAVIISVQDFVRTTKKHSANDEMIDALQEFKAAAQDPLQRDAKCAMAVEMFHLDAQVQDKKIRREDLDAITERFVANQLDQMCHDLRQRSDSGKQKDALIQHNPKAPINANFNSQDYLVTAVDINAAINDFVVDDLQHHAFKDKYEAHQINQARGEIVAAEVAARERGL